ncbi:oxidoreductase [Paenibacillus sp. 32O-W]|uniref:oxidoreductase n=1 Tax=Paenibacillus sp. 32O-W TaxID=1695218 RepID=UPI000721BA4F|nr:oxidoreductase [Paenibacillus sp. 32O-W]ALS28305.1 oxidoreductase [Paenibacillus sp. 32O-W]
MQHEYDKTKEIRVGLVGFGFAGKVFHAPVITAVPGMRLAKIVERNGDSSRKLYPESETVRHVNEVLEDASIDLVVVATPSPTHYAVAREALMAGKHVVVEKPFTATSAEADELIALAARQRKMLSVYHNRRWDGDFMTVRDLVNAGTLGRLVECSLRWDRFRPVPDPSRWREGEAAAAGIWYDLGVHFLDQVLCLFGPPETIRADIRSLRDGAVADDYFDVTLEYPGPLIVRIGASLLAREPGPRYVLHGTNGSFVKHGIDPQEEALIRGMSPASSGWGVELEAQWGRLHAQADGLEMDGRLKTKAGSYVSYYRNIYEHLTAGADLAVTAEQARKSIRLLELGLQSSREGRTLAVRL